MKHFLAALAILLLLVSPAFATVGVQEDGTLEGQAAELNFSTGLNSAMDGTKATVTLDQAGDLTFRTSLIAAGRVNAFSSAASSSTNLAPSSLPYSVFYKYIGGNNCLEEIGVGTILPNGTSGQILNLILAELDTNGSWIVTPTTSTTITNITFDTKGDFVTLMYLDGTIGWVVLSNSGCTVNLLEQTGIPQTP